MKYTHEGYGETGLPWLGDLVDRRVNLPGGVKLDATQFTTAPVLSGTPVGRTRAEAEAGTGFGPAAATDDEFYLLLSDVHNPQRNNDAEVVRHGTLIRYNYLSGWDALASGIQDRILEVYDATLGNEEGKPS